VLALRRGGARQHRLDLDRHHGFVPVSWGVDGFDRSMCHHGRAHVGDGEKRVRGLLRHVADLLVGLQQAEQGAAFEPHADG
jgi:hypothetical protein